MVGQCPGYYWEGTNCRAVWHAKEAAGKGARNRCARWADGDLRSAGVAETSENKTPAAASAELRRMGVQGRD